MPPILSVVLPVYNCPQYVGHAIESILAQTFEDLELIIIDDGSTDETPDVLRRYSDTRIRHITQANRGLPRTLNRGIDEARGTYIARQDQDDISRPERLARQVSFLAEHPDYGMVGTWAEIWEGDLRTSRLHAHPSDNATLQFELLLDNPFVHSSVVIRKAALERVGPYSTDATRQPPEDYELWSRIARLFSVANIPEPLHVYREVSGSMSRTGSSPFLNHLLAICAENIAWAAGLRPVDIDVSNIAALAHSSIDRVQGRPDFEAMRQILRAAAIRVSSDEPRPERRADDRLETLRKTWNQSRRRGFQRYVEGAARRLATIGRRP